MPVAGDALAVLRHRPDARASEGDGLVFTGARGGPVNDSHLSRRLQALASAAGVPKNVAAYSLRHSYGTRTAGAGVPLLDLARIMGTSVQMIERHYRHHDPERAASHVERTMGGGSPEPGRTLGTRQTPSGTGGRPPRRRGVRTHSGQRAAP